MVVMGALSTRLCRLIGVLFLLAFGLPGGAAATELPRMPSGLSITPHARRLILSATGHAIAPAEMLRREVAPALVPLIVKVAGGAAAESLSRAGLPAHKLSPSFAAVTLPASELPRLFAVPGLLQVDGVRYLRPRLDRSVPYIGATALHSLGVTGRGVMVAIIDTGIDFRHADFRNEDGSSRIAFLVDAATARGSLHPELPDSDNMAVYTKADIDALLVAEAMGQKPPLRIFEIDQSGHGTHVAGIAAGNGRATATPFPPGRYVGVAPDATLCIVKGTRDGVGFADKDILTGVRFCVEQANAMQLPVAVNLSLGSNGGPHDGSSALEQSLDELLFNQKGRALAAAAGNSGTEDLHASSRSFDGSHEIPIAVDAGDGSIGVRSGVTLEVFFSVKAAPTSTGDASGHIDLELRSPSGKVLRASAGASNQGKFQSEGVAILDNSDDTMSGMRSALVLISGENESTSVKLGDWKLRIIGSTERYDVWIVDASADLKVHLRAHLDPDGYVEIPAAARSAISVGAMRTRSDWTRKGGQVVTFDRELFRVAPFSSGGPTLDGRFAPDILAPGEFIISSLSAAAPPTDPRSAFFLPGTPGFLIADDGVHGVLRGTSQATPHVTGAVALLFALDPDLTGSAVREILRTSATNDLFAASYGPRRGFGTLNLQTALLFLRGSPPGPPDPVRSDIGVNFDALSPGVGQAVITVTPRDAHGVPLGGGQSVTITSDAGDWLGPTVDTGWGRYERVLLPHGPRGTQATVKARVQGISLVRTVSVHFVGDTGEIGTPFQMAGCTMLPGQAAHLKDRGSVCFAGLLALLFFSAWRGRLQRNKSGLCLGLGIMLSLGGCSAFESASSEAVGIPSSAQSPGKNPHRAGRFPVGGDYFWQGGETLEQPSIIIHLGEQLLEVFDGKVLVARSSVCSGRRSRPTPAGHFSVLEKIPEHVSSRYGDYIDEGENLVQANIDNAAGPPPPGAMFRGTKMPFFLRFLGGIGLHAGPLPGYPDSHGCVRLPPFVAQRLFFAVPVGTPVEVQN